MVGIPFRNFIDKFTSTAAFRFSSFAMSSYIWFRCIKVQSGIIQMELYIWDFCNLCLLFCLINTSEVSSNIIFDIQSFADILLYLGTIVWTILWNKLSNMHFINNVSFPKVLSSDTEALKIIKLRDLDCLTKLRILQFNPMKFEVPTLDRRLLLSLL